MKRLLLILLTIFSLGNIVIYAEKTNGCIKILLQESVSDDDDVPINKEGGPIVRSIYMPIADAYLYNNVVNISFNASIAVVNVTITNESTGETVYSETHSSPTALSIDLNGESSDNYRIEIEAKNTRLEGNFNL